MDEDTLLGCGLRAGLIDCYYWVASSIYTGYSSEYNIIYDWFSDNINIAPLIVIVPSKWQNEVHVQENDRCEKVVSVVIARGDNIA